MYERIQMSLKLVMLPIFRPHTRNNSGWGDEVPCDPFYWPVPKVDASCQSIIVAGIERLHKDATTDAKGQSIGAILFPLSSADSEGQSVLHTAMLLTMNSVIFKMPSVNLWTHSGSVTFSPHIITFRPAPNPPRALQPRAHCLVVGQSRPERIERIRSSYHYGL